MPKLSVHLIMIAMTSLLFGAYSTHAGASSATILTCNENDAVPIQDGVLLNNMWNKVSAGAGAWQQCLQSRVSDGKTEYGWSWSWPVKDGLYAFPEVLVGSSPWQATPTNDLRFPIAIGDMQKLQISYDVESQATGKKNLATEFWITNAPPKDGQSNIGSIKTELMIWSDASTGLISPNDKPAGTLDINGSMWTVYVNRNWRDASGGTGNNWDLVSYHAEKNTSSISYDASVFLNDAVARGLVDRTDYIWGVELGNEIVSGSGSTWIKSFQVLVNPIAPPVPEPETYAMMLVGLAVIGVVAHRRRGAAT